MGHSLPLVSTGLARELLPLVTIIVVVTTIHHSTTATGGLWSVFEPTVINY